MNLLKISDQHTIFEASAGTGKTYTIVRVVLHLIGIEDIPLSNLAVLTFTEKAASELEDRIRSEMISPKNDFNLSEEEFSKYQKRIQSKVKDLPRATIGTIHSFCRVILRKYAFRIGFSNQFLEARGIKEDVDQRFHYFFEKYERENPKLLELILDKISYSDLYIFINELIDKFPDSRYYMNFENETQEEVLSVLEDIISLMRSVSPPVKKSTSYPKIISCLEELDQTEDILEKFQIYIDSIQTNSATVNHHIANLFGENKEELIELNSRFNDIYNALINKEILLPVVDFSNQFLEFFHSESEKKDTIYLSHLIFKTKKLIDTFPDIKEEIRKDLSFLILDECQDTDPLQLSLFVSLFEGARKGVILVGDPKQSIYRFRGADLDAFLKTKEILNPREESLSTCYRSSKNLISVFNSIFSKIPELNYKPILSKRDNSEFGEHPIPKPLFCPGLDENGIPITSINGEQINSENIHSISIREIISIIRHLHGNDDTKIYDKSKDSLRKIKFSDISILARSKDGLKEMFRELQKANIPASIYNINLLFQDPLVKAISELLTSLGDPYNSTAIYNTLISDLFNFPESVLLKLLEEDSLNYLYPCPDEDLETIFLKFRSVHKKRYSQPASFSLKTILEDLGVYERMSIGFKGERNITNIHHVYEVLDQFQFLENYNFTETGNQFRSLCNEEIEREFNLKNIEDKHSETEGAVTLMTIHASKGLEFPVTILFEIHTQVQKKNEMFVKYPLREKQTENQIEFKIGKYVTKNYEVELSNKLKKEEEELTRLLYVGMTRAIDYLVIPFYCYESSLTKKTSSILNVLLDNSANIKEMIPDEFVSEFRPEQIQDQESEKIKYSLSPVEEITEDYFTDGISEYDSRSIILPKTYTSISKKLHSPLSQVVLQEEKDIEEESEIQSSSESTQTVIQTTKGDAAKFGIACHSVLEMFPLETLKHPKERDRALRELCKETFSKSEIDSSGGFYTEELMQKYILSALKRSYNLSGKETSISDWNFFQREMKFFNFKHTASQYYMGIVDGIFEYGGKYYLLDWKTDKLNPEDDLRTIAESKYSIQVSIYSAILLQNLKNSMIEDRDLKTIYDKYYGGILYVFLSRTEPNQVNSVLLKPELNNDVLQYTGYSKNGN